MLKISLNNFVDWFREDNYRRLKVLILCFILFICSIVFRTMFSSWFHRNRDVTPYISPEGYYWETYDDAIFYYVNYLNAFKNRSWTLYTPNLERPLGGYYYGPVFVYLLSFLSLFVGIFNPNSTQIDIAWKTIIFAPQFFDSLSTVLIFLILLRRKKEEQLTLSKISQSFLSSIIFTVMPIVVFYNDIMYLNSYMFTFFTLLAYYLFTNKKHKLAGIILSLGFMSKQIALFFIPVFAIYLYRINRRKSLEFLISFVVTSFILSIPWIFMNPVWYLGSLFAPGTAQFHIQFSVEYRYVLWPTSIYHTFLYWGFNNVAYFYYVLNLYQIPFLIFNLIAYLYVLLMTPKLSKDLQSSYSFLALFSIGIHLFLARGCFKYYDSFFIPFIVIAVSKRIMRINNKYLRFPVLLLVSGGIIYLNLMTIIWIKWLHLVFVSIFFIIIALTIKPSLYLEIFKKENYQELKNYFEEGKQQRKERREQRLEKKKMKKERINRANDNL